MKLVKQATLLIVFIFYLSTLAHAAEELLNHRLKYDEVLLTVEVVRVIDGDSFKVLLDGKPESIRILCIDTPEKGEPGWKEEGDKLRARIGGKTIKIKTNKYHKKGNYLRDKYGRILAEIHDPASEVCPPLSFVPLPSMERGTHPMGWVGVRGIALPPGVLKPNVNLSWGF